MYCPILADVNRQLKKNIRWSPLPSMTGSNSLFIGKNADSLVLRINAAPNLTPGISRAREAAVLRQIQGQTWGPEIIINHWPHGWCTSRFHGPTISNRINEQIRHDLSQIIADMHEIRQGASWDYGRLWQHYRSNLPKNCRRELEQLIVEIGQLPSLPSCLVHHDLHPGNICQEKNRLVIIDWEYAGIGLSWFDLAALQQQFSFTLADIARFPLVSSLDRSNLQAGLVLAIRASERLASLWYRIRPTSTMSGRV